MGKGGAAKEAEGGGYGHAARLVRVGPGASGLPGPPPLLCGISTVMAIATNIPHTRTHTAHTAITAMRAISSIAARPAAAEAACTHSHIHTNANANGSSNSSSSNSSMHTGYQHEYQN
eukprot:28494-Chlamydomonas_euryale.AAC.2